MNSRNNKENKINIGIIDIPKKNDKIYIIKRGRIVDN